MDNCDLEITAFIELLQAWPFLASASDSMKYMTVLIVLRFAFSDIYSLTLAFCMTLPLGAIKEAGLFFSADAELTGEAWSALTLLLEGWTDDDDDDEDDDDDDDDTVDDDDVWGAGMAADLV